jgi:hypothetical protein
MDRIDKKISMALAKYRSDPLTGIENLYQLSDGHEYAKLGIDEKDLSHSWDFWNRSSPGL